LVFFHKKTDLISIEAHTNMIQKTIRKSNLAQYSSAQENLAYWLSRSPEERLAAVDYLRHQYYGSSTDFKELLGLFNARHVDYLIVGGYALAFHGAPRFTGDLDILVKPDPDNAQKILLALTEFGFGSLGLTSQDFIETERVVQLGVPPVRIDIITSLTGVTWPEAWAGKISSRFGDVPVYIIGRAEFVMNKRALGRKRDLADMEALGED